MSFANPICKVRTQKPFGFPINIISRILSECGGAISYQRAGIADGGEFYIRPPITAAWLFDKVKY